MYSILVKTEINFYLKKIERKKHIYFKNLLLKYINRYNKSRLSIKVLVLKRYTKTFKLMALKEMKIGSRVV